MIGQAVDRLIGVFAPAAAARRAHARTVYDNVSQRAYEAARRDRMNANWRPQNRSADLDLSLAADEMRARARDLVQNNAYARGIVDSLTRNVVGCGIRPQCRIESEETAEQIEAAFDRWQRRCDRTGRLSFYRLQQLAYHEVKEAGEVLVRFVHSDDRRRSLPLAIELVDADLIATDHFPRGRNTENGNEVRRGIELNEDGAPVAYWLYTSHPNGLNSWRQQAKRFDADDFIHLFKQERIGQTRGVTAFAPVLNWVRNLGYYVDNELQASAVASCLTAVIKTMGAEADGGLGAASGADGADTNGMTFDHFEPGLVARLFPGEDAEIFNPTRGHQDSQVFIDLMIRSMAVGTGLSYERLSRDYSKTNYSSNRASDLEDRRSFRPEQDWLAETLCVPTWERFMVSAVTHELPGFPSPMEFISDFDAWTEHIWQPPGWEWVDPTKEQKASADAVEANLSTLEEELGKRGRDWKDVLTQRAREKELITELGLDAPSPSEMLAAETAAETTAEPEPKEEPANATA